MPVQTPKNYSYFSRSRAKASHPDSRLWFANSAALRNKFSRSISFSWWPSSPDARTRVWWPSSMSSLTNLQSSKQSDQVTQLKTNSNKYPDFPSGLSSFRRWVNNKLIRFWRTLKIKAETSKCSPLARKYLHLTKKWLKQLIYQKSEQSKLCKIETFKSQIKGR